MNALFLALVLALTVVAAPAAAQESTEPAKPQPPAIAAGKDGFTLKSADGAFQLKLRGYVQADGRFWLGDDERPAADTFLLRRIRPILEGTLYEIFDFRIMPDFGEGQTRLFDGYVEARFTPAAKLRAGKFKPPVGLERLQSATDIVFVERALPSNLVPNRDVGVQLSGDLAAGRLNYAVGVFNGVADGGSGDTDTDDSKDAAARLFATPFAKEDGPLEGLGFGIAASRGNQRGTAAAPALPIYRTPGQQTFFSYRTDGVASGGPTLADGARERFSPQAYLYRGPLGLMAEHVRSSQEVRRGTTTAELTHDAWQLAASWVLTGEDASFRGVPPRAPFDRETGAWGAVELVARFSALDVDDDAFPFFADPAVAASEATAWAVGVNWYLGRGVRLGANYETTSFEGGAPTGDREDERVLLTRLQINF
jgi:phosphate-selective porin OprO and OprP